MAMSFYTSLCLTVGRSIVRSVCLSKKLFEALLSNTVKSKDVKIYE